MIGRLRGDGGQAAVEVALVLPVVAIMAMLLVQLALVVRDQVLVTAAAREGAREAAVDADPGAPRRAALAGTALDGDRLQVEVADRGPPGGRVRVEVRYRARTDLPLVGRLLGDIDLTADATIRVER